MRNERWNTTEEIKRCFRESSEVDCGSGPVIYAENGRRYCDCSSAHIEVIGRTGGGKTECGSNPFMREVLLHRESLVVLDSKGQGDETNGCFIPEDYQVFRLDFRRPRQSRDGWNPLSAPYRLFTSGDPDDHDVASAMINDLWRGVYPPDDVKDPFWPEAAANYAKGLTYGLFETARKDQINLESIGVMMDHSEEKSGIGIGSTLLKAFYEKLPASSLAKRGLAAYVSGPNDTRASIHSVASNGLEVFCRSRGLMEMLSTDTLNVLDIDVTRPFAVIIIIPDETEAYDALAGLLIGQITNHLTRTAQQMGGKLPIRVNIILEELGSVGKSIPSLHKLMTAGRSRNIRLMLVLQSKEQLVDIYGKSKAKTIEDSVGITIGFSTNCWETMTEWSKRCGERQREGSGHMMNEQLITASQLAAMPAGTALVMIGSRYKFITHFPRFDEMYDNSAWTPPKTERRAARGAHGVVDFQTLVQEMQEKQKQQKQSDFSFSIREETPEERPSKRSEPIDFDAFMDSIDAEIRSLDEQIAALEAKPDAPEAKSDTFEERGSSIWQRDRRRKRWQVMLTGISGNRIAIADMLAHEMSITMTVALRKMDALPVKISFPDKMQAISFLVQLERIGGKAELCERPVND